MKIAVMQPYFLPYLGYFQLIAAVDRFVFYDDVNFMKKGWVNRNQLLHRGEKRLFSIPLSGASQNRRINEIPLAIDSRWRHKFFRTIESSYSRAPNYESTVGWLSSLLGAEYDNIGELAKASVKSVCSIVGLSTELVDSSSKYGNVNLKGQERILDICLRENSKIYVNAQNGRHLYDPLSFQSRDIELRFISPTLKPYVDADKLSWTGPPAPVTASPPRTKLPQSPPIAPVAIPPKTPAKNPLPDGVQRSTCRPAVR